jgi:hypothetical protein
VFLRHRVVASVVAMQFERDGVVIAALALLLGAIGLAAAIPNFPIGNPTCCEERHACVPYVVQ